MREMGLPTAILLTALIAALLQQQEVQVHGFYHNALPIHQHHSVSVASISTSTRAVPVPTKHFMSSKGFATNTKDVPSSISKQQLKKAKKLSKFSIKETDTGTRVPKSFNHTSIDEFATAFLKMGVKGKNIGLSPKERTWVAQNLERVAPELSISNLMKVITSLSYLRMYDSRNSVMIHLAETLVSQFASYRGEATGKEFSTMIMGFARMGLNMEDSPILSKESKYILEALPRAVSSMDSSSLTNTIWAMGKIGGMSWDALTHESVFAVSSAFEKHAARVAPLNVANTIYGTCA